MQFLPALLVAAVAATQTSGSLQRSDPVLVRRVIDGATIEVAAFGRVRLLGLTAPFGRAARDRLESLVLRHWVRLEYDAPAIATSRRHVAYVIREDGVFVNAAIVRDGLARVSTRTAFTRHQELQRAERDARALRLGMWAQPAPFSRQP
jgi:endonuclease YncB( thermonuclease family)